TGDGLADLSLEEFWENVSDLGDMTVLATNHGSGKGWSDYTLYNFHLDFNLVPGEIHIVVKEGDTVLWDHTVHDTTFTGGQFGFYNNSQERVEYAGFVQTGGVLVGVPDAGWTAGMLGLGVMVLGISRRLARR